jgi:hypothetical protein
VKRPQEGDAEADIPHRSRAHRIQAEAKLVIPVSMQRLTAAIKNDVCEFNHKYPGTILYLSFKSILPN